MKRTARYRMFIYDFPTCNQEIKAQRAAWHRFVTLCKHLEADGFAFAVDVQRAGENNIRITIQGTAGRAKKRKPRATVRRHVRCQAPPAPKPEQCTKQRERAEATVKSALSRLPGSLRQNWLEEPGYHSREWMEHKAADKPLRRRIGRAVARILARKHMKPGMDPWRWGSHTWTAEDYAALDAAVGRKVERASQVSEGMKNRHHGYLGYIVKTYAGSWRYGSRKSEADESDRYTAPNMIAEYQKARADLDFWREMEAASGRRERWKPGLNDDNFYGDEAAA